MSDTLYVGVDVHEKESQLAIFEQDGALVEEKRLPTGELAEFLSSLPGQKHIAMESVGFVYPIYDRLSSLQDCTVTVANPNKLQLISRSSTKRDRADARVLGDLLGINYLHLLLVRRPEASHEVRRIVHPSWASASLLSGDGSRYGVQNRLLGRRQVEDYGKGRSD